MKGNLTDHFKNLTGSIALVGNSKRSCNEGSEVDSNDSVIRMNLFPPGEYGDLVGKKVTHWAINGLAFAKKRYSRVRAVNPEIVIVMDSEPRAKLNELTTSNDVLVVFPHEPAKRPFEYPQQSSPSLGFLVLLRLEALGKHVHLFGFDGCQTGNYWSPSHEHKRHTKDAKMELDYIRERHGKTFTYHQPGPWVA